MLLDALQLIRSENVGAVTYRNLLQYYETPADALAAIPDLAARGGKRKIHVFDRDSARIEIERTHAAGAQMLCIHEDAYPASLREIPDAPPVLIYKGDLTALTQRDMVGIVGARNASTTACQFARKVARDLGAADIAVVSGLARGIDAAAHVGALETGTIGVIASGIDVVYPKENEALYAEMAQRGVILTENPIGMEPLNRSFPARNRIIAGLSSALVVIEGGDRSGTLITARDAAEYGREVFAVPGSPLDPRCAGTNKLIKQGANLLESAEDVLAFLRDQTRQLAEPKSSDFQAAPFAVPDASEVASARQILLERLSQTPVLVDEWLAQCDVAPHIVVAAMLELELAGRLIRHANGAVSLALEVESA